MESVGSNEEEDKLNSCVPAPHIIPYSSSSTPFLEQVPNPATETSLVSENYGIEATIDGTTETIQWYKGGK